MLFFLPAHEVLASHVIMYNVILSLVFIFLFWKYKGFSIAQCILLLFTVGIMSDFGGLLGVGSHLVHIQKTIVLLWISYLGWQNREYIERKWLLGLFGLYLLYFVGVSLFYHHDNLFLVVSQSVNKMLPIVFLLVMMAYVNAKKQAGLLLLNSVFKDLIIAQIVFCVIKLLILKSTQEGLVGSLTGVSGGGVGASFPLLALLWVAYNTKMKLSWSLVGYVVGLLFIGFMTGKRAIWLTYPLLFVFLMLMYRVKDVKQIFKFILPTLLVAFLFFYLGVRMIPTLNPDFKFWGRFDPNYAIGYALYYSGGSYDENGDIAIVRGRGRLGAVKLFVEEVIDVDKYNGRIIFGVGNDYMLNAPKEKYYNPEGYYFGVNYRGGITGIVMMYFISGLIGVLLFLIYFISMFFSIKNKKWLLLLLFVVLFDFIFYNAQLVENIAVSVFVMYFIVLLSVEYQIKNFKIVG